MATLRQRRVDRTGDGEYLTTLLGGRARRDEGTRRERSLDDQAALCQPADQSIAAREIVRQCLGTERELR